MAAEPSARVVADIAVANGDRLVVTCKPIPDPTTQEIKQQQVGLPPGIRIDYPEHQVEYVFTLVSQKPAKASKKLWSCLDGHIKGTPPDYAFKLCKADIIGNQFVVVYQRFLSVWAYVSPVNAGDDGKAPKYLPRKLIQGSEIYGPIVTKVDLDYDNTDHDLSVTIWQKKDQIGKFILKGSGLERRWIDAASGQPFEKPSTSPVAPQCD